MDKEKGDIINYYNLEFIKQLKGHLSQIKLSPVNYNYSKFYTKLKMSRGNHPM